MRHMRSLDRATLYCSTAGDLWIDSQWRCRRQTIRNHWWARRSVGRCLGRVWFRRSRVGATYPQEIPG